LALTFKTLLAVASAVLALGSVATAQDEDHRIVSVGGDVTEIVYALGHGEHVVATDSTSVYPPEARETPKVGYVRQLAAESLLSLNPSLLILGGAAGPEPVVEQLRALGVNMLELDTEYTIDAVRHKVEQVAGALGEAEAGAAMIADINADWAEFQQIVARTDSRPTALFFASLGDGGPRAAGTGTAAHAVLEYLGVENAFGDRQGYRALSTEAAVAADPDFIFVMSHNARLLGGLEAVGSDPALALTSAGRNGRIIAVDSVRIMSFGPRFAEGMVEAALALETALEAPIVQ